ncbi:MAG: hypothetical protein EBQ63_00065 [Actinobacteria bacterium]|nr:hypothetical protein [Actinomycetota bacterium]
MKITSWIKSERHQQLIERWWIAIVMTWGLIRTVVVDKTFAKYGVNPYVYLAIVVSISVPYAISTAKLFFAIIERHLRKSLSLRLSHSYFTLRQMPTFSRPRNQSRTIFDGFILLIAIFTILGIREIVVKVREHKRANSL